MKLFKSLLILALSLLFLVGCKGTYKVTFDTNSDEVVEAISVSKDSAITELPDVERVGYTFDGWYLDEDLSEKYDDQIISENTTLYAKWTIKEYTVTFMKDNVEHAKVTVKHGEAATAPSDPTKVGHEFVRWDVDFSNVTSDLVVRAVFDKDSYQVTFMNGDSQIGDVQNVLFGEAATAPTDPVKEGYRFTGWDKAFDNVTSDLVVYAEFEILTYTVRFLDHDGTELQSLTIEHGQAATAPANPTRTGYTFKEWDVDFSNVTSDLDVTAVYEVAKYTVEFMSGTTLVETQTIEHGQAATAPTTNPEIEGYTFTGWDKDFSNVTSNLIVNAQFNAIEYDIEYYDGTTLLTHTPNKYNIETSISLTNYDKDGYIFVGWYLQSDYSDEALENIASGQIGTIKLYGKWLDESDTLAVTYELNGGSWKWTSTTVTTPGNGIDEYSSLPEIFMLDYYTYLKDNDLLTSSNVHTSLHKTSWEDFSANYNDPVAIYNHTESNTSATTNGYSQFFYESATGNADTGELLSIEGGFFGTEPYKTKYYQLVRHISLLQKNKYSVNFWGGAAAKSLAGFILDGYFYGTQGAGEGDFLALRKAIPNVDLGYTFDGGSTLKPITSTYPITSYVNGLEGRLSMPSKEGSFFAGWYANADFSGDRVEVIPAGTTPAATYYAKWVACEEFTLSFYDGDTLLSHTPDKYNQEIEVELVEFVKTGYDFLGWYLTPDFTDEPVQYIQKGTNGDLKFYGKWVEYSTVNYVLNGGSWTWSTSTVTTPGDGIDAYSNLPEIFMIDFYTYLKDNNLLTSSKVAASLQKTTWTDFSANYTDPVAIYNHTSTNTSKSTDGYNQLFFDSMTGDEQTGKVLSVQGGFFGTEPYKSKYASLLDYLSLLLMNKYSGNFLWDGPAAISLAGFAFDGYFYGTQGAGTGKLLELRKNMPNTNIGYEFDGTTLNSYNVSYPVTSFSSKTVGVLSLPSKEGFVFAGWYTTSDLSGDRVDTIAIGETPASTYYAKWVAVADY